MLVPCWFRSKSDKPANAVFPAIPSNTPMDTYWRCSSSLLWHLDRLIHLLLGWLSSSMIKNVRGSHSSVSTSVQQYLYCSWRSVAFCLPLMMTAHEVHKVRPSISSPMPNKAPIPTLLRRFSAAHRVVVHNRPGVWRQADSPQSAFPSCSFPSTLSLQKPATPTNIPPENFPHKVSVPIIVDLEATRQFGEGDVGGSNLARIADQLPATTFWAFAWEYFSKLPELLFREPGE